MASLPGAPPPSLPPKPEVSTPPPTEPRPAFTPESAARDALRPMAGSRFDSRERDRDMDRERERDGDRNRDRARDWERDRGRGYGPPPARPHSPQRRDDDRRHSTYSRPPYPRDRSRDADRGRRESERDGPSNYDRRPPYSRPYVYQDSRGPRFPPTRSRYRSPPPYRRRTRSPASRRSPPPRRRLSPSPPPSRRLSRSPRRTPIRRSRSRSPLRRYPRRSRSRSPRPEKSRLPQQHYPPIGAPTSPRSHREHKLALQHLQPQLPTQIHQPAPSQQEPTSATHQVKEEGTKPVLAETSQIHVDAPVIENPVEVNPVRPEENSTISVKPSTEAIPEPAAVAMASRSPSPLPQNPPIPIYTTSEPLAMETQLAAPSTSIQSSPVKEVPEFPRRAASPSFKQDPLPTKPHLREDLVGHGASSPVTHHLSHVNKESPYSPRPAFRPEDRSLGHEHLKPTPALPPQNIIQDISTSTSASHSPRPPFHTSQPERIPSGDLSHLHRPSVPARLGGPRADNANGHEQTPRLARGIFSETEMFELNSAWQQRLLLEKEEWKLSHQIYHEMQELDLAMMDLRAAQARRKIAECMLDKAKAGMFGIDAATPSSFGESEENVDIVMSLY